MSEIELLQRAGLAVAIGLLIGIERGWQTRQAKDGSRVAGVRTFTLIGALGGICGLLPGTRTLGLPFAALAIRFGSFQRPRARPADHSPATGVNARPPALVPGAYAVPVRRAAAPLGV